MAGIGELPGEVGADRPDRGAPAQAESRPLLDPAPEAVEGVARVVECRVRPLVEDAEFVLEAAHQESLAADHVVRLVPIADALKGVAAHAAVAAREEAKPPRQPEEILDFRIAHLGTPDQPLALAQ